MLVKIRDLIFAKLLKDKSFSDEEMFSYALMVGVNMITSALYTFFLVFFFIIQVYPMVLSNVVGLMFCVIVALSIRAKRYDLAGGVLSASVILYTLSTVLFVGGSNYSILYFFILLLMQFLIPFHGRRTHIFFIVLLFVGFVASWVLEACCPPVYSLGMANTVLKIANIMLAFLAFVVLLSLEKAIRKVIDRVKQMKIEELQDQAYIDPLTKLYNRRYADLYFEEISASFSMEDICVALVDIDDFKLVNDTYGHEAGDVALKAVSEVFINNTRKTDLVFRWGGEEFLLIIGNAKPADTYRLLDKIRVMIHNMPIVHEGKEFHLTVTMGMSQLDSDNIQRSLEACDRKLYIGKKTGKDIVVM